MSLPQRVYSVEQVKELDRIAIEEHHIDGYELMSRAAHIVFNTIRKHYPATNSVNVLCGKGNNAGDGYLFAKLALAQQWKVNVIAIDMGALQDDAERARQAWLSTGELISSFDEKLPSADVVVDALLGIGLSRAPEGNWLKAIQAMNRFMGRVVSIDVPSGLEANTGVILSTAVKADITVTLIGMKQGLLTGQARNVTGTIIYNDLNIPPEAFDKVESTVRIIPSDIVKTAFKPREASSHKGDHGHVMLVGGNEGMSGAITLAAQAAARTGAGVVTVVTHASHRAMMTLACPEVLTQPSEDLLAVNNLIEKSDVIAIGPGMGEDQWAHNLLAPCLYTGQPKVLDADALNMMIHTPSRRSDWILTPHPGEAARMLSVTTNEIEKNRYDAAIKIQQKYGGVCVLKGAGTLIATENGIAICTIGNAGMATAGSGDVLTGIIAGLLVQGLSLSKAAIVGVYLHALAGDEAAKAGQRGMLASDIINCIRGLVNT